MKLQRTATCHKCVHSGVVFETIDDYVGQLEAEIAKLQKTIHDMELVLAIISVWAKNDHNSGQVRAVAMSDIAEVADRVLDQH